jgi:hypothetical protein
MTDFFTMQPAETTAPDLSAVLTLFPGRPIPETL